MANSKGRTREWMQMAKRNAVVAAIVLFVCVAVYLNWNYQNAGSSDVGKTLGDAALVDGQTGDPLVSQSGETEQEQGGGAAASSYFANARLNRQQARDSALSVLQETVANTQADQAMKEQASTAIQTMAGYTVTEAQIENLVVAKGYADCVAFIGEDSVSVVVELTEGELTSADTARIVDIVASETDFPASRIKIIDVASAK